MSGASGSHDRKQAKVRSGFERDVQSGKLDSYREIKTGINDLGNGTKIGFYSQHFAQNGKNMLQSLKAGFPPLVLAVALILLCCMPCCSVLWHCIALL